MLLKIDGGKKKILMLSMMFGVVVLFSCGCSVGSMGMPQDFSGIWSLDEYGQETETKNSYEEESVEKAMEVFLLFQSRVFFFR